MWCLITKSRLSLLNARLKISDTLFFVDGAHLADHAKKERNKVPSKESLLFRPLEVKRASKVIFEQALELIRCGELKPCDRLPSKKNMMEIFQRNRPTVREVLRRLEQAGYIRTSGDNAGAVVLTPDVENTMADALSVGQVSQRELGKCRSVVLSILIIPYLSETASEKHPQRAVGDSEWEFIRLLILFSLKWLILRHKPCE